MKLFSFSRPTSLAAAIAEGSTPGATFLAGGTNLLDLMKGEVLRPEKLVDLSAIEDLRGIETGPAGEMRIGASVTNGDLARDTAVAGRFPSVVEALLSGASGQLRNAATVGGNILQKTRCPYFYDTASRCNKRTPAQGCDALDGENRSHAILGWNETCIATHPSDLCVPLVALGATVEIDGPDGRRTVALTELLATPEETQARGDTLGPGEIIIAVTIPAKAAKFASHSRYLKVRERTSYAFATVSVAASLALDAGKVTDARIALGGVAATPWKRQEAEQCLVGQPPDTEAFALAANALLAEARPSGQNAYKIELARRTVMRALHMAAAGTPSHVPALPGSLFSSPEGADS